MNYKNEGPVQELCYSFGEISLEEIIFIEIRIKKGNNGCENVISISKGGGDFINSTVLIVKADSLQVSRLCILVLYLKGVSEEPVSPTPNLCACCPGSDAQREDQTG